MENFKGAVEMKPRRFGRTNQSCRRCRSYQSSKNRPGLFAAEQPTNQPTLGTTATRREKRQCWFPPVIYLPSVLFDMLGRYRWRQSTKESRQQQQQQRQQQQQPPPPNAASGNHPFLVEEQPLEEEDVCELGSVHGLQSLVGVSGVSLDGLSVQLTTDKIGHDDYDDDLDSPTSRSPSTTRTTANASHYQYSLAASPTSLHPRRNTVCHHHSNHYDNINNNDNNNDINHHPHDEAVANNHWSNQNNNNHEEDAHSLKGHSVVGQREDMDDDDVSSIHSSHSLYPGPGPVPVVVAAAADTGTVPRSSPTSTASSVSTRPGVPDLYQTRQYQHHQAQPPPPPPPHRMLILGTCTTTPEQVVSYHASDNNNNNGGMGTGVGVQRLLGVTLAATADSTLPTNHHHHHNNNKKTKKKQQPKLRLVDSLSNHSTKRSSFSPASHHAHHHPTEPKPSSTTSSACVPLYMQRAPLWLKAVILVSLLLMILAVVLVGATLREASSSSSSTSSSAVAGHHTILVNWTLPGGTTAVPGTVAPSAVAPSSPPPPPPLLLGYRTVTFYATAGRLTAPASSTLSLAQLLSTLPTSVPVENGVKKGTTSRNDTTDVVFLAQLGDWNDPYTTNCNAQAYLDVADEYGNASLPVYFVVEEGLGSVG